MSADFVPAISTRLPLGSVFRIGELPMSMSGPIGFGHASLAFGMLQPAMIASVVFGDGAVVASPVPKYTARLTGSIVGEFHTAPPAGAYSFTPFDIVLYTVGSSGITQAFQISL